MMKTSSAENGPFWNLLHLFPHLHTYLISSLKSEQVGSPSNRTDLIVWTWEMKFYSIPDFVWPLHVQTAMQELKWNETWLSFAFRVKWDFCSLFPIACSHVSTSWTCATRGPACTMRWTATKPRPLSWNLSHYPAAPTSRSSTKYPPCTHRYLHSGFILDKEYSESCLLDLVALMKE